MKTEKTDEKKPNSNPQVASDFMIFGLVCILAFGAYTNYWEPLTQGEKTLIQISAVMIVLLICSLGGLIYLQFFSSFAKKQKELKTAQELVPSILKDPSATSCFLGSDEELQNDIFLPDSIRSRHVHIIGATGSGKTESTILNLIGQDIEHGHPIVILDAKGDDDFLKYLQVRNLGDKLKIFDLGDENTPYSYNPMQAGSPTEAGQRLFNSLTWSEEYYKTKARRVIKRFFEARHSKDGKNPTLFDFSCALEKVEKLNQAVKGSDDERPFLSSKEFEELSGLVDQIDQLASGPMKNLLSPAENQPTISVGSDIQNKKIIYFRLQSMLDSESVAVISKLIINELANCAAHAQRNGNKAHFCPVFLDEFASFVCAPFIDVISKARSAGFALHFSHQSMGNVQKHGPEFISEIVDNSSTRIVMRTYDPGTTEFLAKCFGTKDDTKFTHKMEGDSEDHTVSDVGSLREVQAFQVNPSDIKKLPTGQGYVFIAHGMNHKGSGANVFRLTFPKLNKEKHLIQATQPERKMS
ncbi:type IV secretion system DNA-binding domain-containing protein [bacterium]|nr:type IV secretion system DNA-binding domain-containing protein [bacterium]